MATVPFNLECDVASGFRIGPDAHPRVGYVTALDGLGLPAGGLKADLTVTSPVTGDPMTVVGVLEKFSWAGGPGDDIQVFSWISQENVVHLREMQQAAVESAAVTQLGWWIVDYDHETKAWFEKSYPLSPLSGIIPGKDKPALEVGLNPRPAVDGIDVMVYKVSIKVAPAANLEYSLQFAESPTKKNVKSWGLKVGNLATAEVPPPS